MKREMIMDTSRTDFTLSAIQLIVNTCIGVAEGAALAAALVCAVQICGRAAQVIITVHRRHLQPFAIELRSAVGLGFCVAAGLPRL